MESYLRVLRLYTRFHGRARRSEYWYFNLISTIIFLLLAAIDASLLKNAAGVGILQIIYELGVFLPSLAVTVRRLHDMGRSGWWNLITLVPIIGTLIRLYFLIQDSEPGKNRFGRNPKESSIQ